MTEDSDVASLILETLQAATALRRQGDRIAAIAGQTQARWQVLTIVADGETTVPRIARRLGFARQSVQRIVDALIEDGLCATGTNPDHARSPLVHLTAAGDKAVDRILAVAYDFHAMIAEKLNSKDIASARAVMETLGQLADETATPES